MKALSPQQRAALAILLPSNETAYWMWRLKIRPFRQSTRKRLEDDGLIQIEGGYVRITDEGRRVLEQ
jgi:predicted methyltransferase